MSNCSDYNCEGPDEFDHYENGRNDERSAVVAYLRERDRGSVSAAGIERGEHVKGPQ